MLNQTFTITSQTPTIDPTGFVVLSPSADATVHKCSWQPERSAEVMSQNVQNGIETGVLYYPESLTITIDDTVVVVGVGTYDVIGPSVRAPGNPYRYVPVSREYR